MAGLIDKVKSWFATEPTASAITISGAPSTRNSGFDGGGKWPYSLSRQSLSLDHNKLRQGARLAMQDSPQGRAIVERKVDAISGTGIKLEPTPDITVLGITQEQAATWSTDIAARFDLWANDKKQHRAESMTYYQAQWLHSYFKERDNDVFIRLYYSPDRGLQNPLQFEFIDPDQIRGQAFTSSWGFQPHEDGIERDSRGRETGFKVWVKDDNGNYKEVSIKKKGSKSGRIFMLHGFRPEYAGQGRGFTKLAPIIQDLENFTDFSAAHIKQAINQAQIVGWVVPSEGEDAQPIFDNKATAFGAGPAATNFSNDTDQENTTALEDFKCYDIPEATFSQPGSTWIQELTKGADIKLANPNSPATSYDRFHDAFLTSLSACSGTPLEVVQMKFGNSFSASRATLLLFQRIVEIEREDINADMNNPVKEMWMAGEIAAGRVSAPGWSDPRLRAAWLKCTWRGAPVPDIDPGKLAKARRDNLEIGVTNVEREAQQHTGMSALDNIGINNRIFKDYEPLPFSKGVVSAEPVKEEEDD